MTMVLVPEVHCFAGAGCVRMPTGQRIRQALLASAGLHHPQPVMRTRRALAGVDLGHTDQEVLRDFLGEEVERWYVQGGIDLVWSVTDIRTVQVLLGHSDVATTMIYTHVLKVAAGGTSSPPDAIALGS